MTKKILAEKIIEALKIQYPEVKCALTYQKPHELLIATRLSAQCTDVRVNKVTPALFERFPTIKDFADADEAEVSEYIHSCGLFQTKARDIVKMCKQLHEDYCDAVPDTVEELTKLAGVGRKTANLIVGELYGKTAFVCDTHVIRLSNKLGLAEGKDAVKVEKQLRAIVPAKEGLGLCHRLVWHGRLVCNARKPMCSTCCLKDLCKSKKIG
ncbi:MAG: endonuclease III [Firmicutes bacterium]|nr:endonuclease III [[Eubacterium] siraeum]MCM1487847.1 endonuclease III [Bacillota bacterium]